MAVETRSAHPSLLWPGVAENFGMEYKDKPEYWRRLFTELTSTKHIEITAEHTFYGLAPTKSEGSSISYDQAEESFRTTFQTVTYGLGYLVTREAIEDGLYENVANARASELARSMRATKETVHANIFKRAFNSSYLGGDGVTLCSTAHPTRSGNQSNRLTVDADLSEAAIEDAIKIIVNMKNPRAIKAEIMPRTLLVPVNEMFNAVRFVNSTLRPSTSNNDVNAINDMNALPDGTIVYPYLDSDDDAWFVLTDLKKGLKCFNRRDVDFDKDEDFGTENARAKSTMRFVPGWDNWRCVVGSAGAG